MNEESFESLKEDIVGEPLVGLLFGEPIAVVVVPLDYSPVLTPVDIDNIKSAFSPEDTIMEWWHSAVRAAWKQRWPDDPS